MPGEAGVTVVTMLACFFHSHARLRARWRARHSLRPLMSEGTGPQRKTRADYAARSRRCGCYWKNGIPYPPSFRDGPKDQTRNLEIPGSMLRIAPEW